MAKPLTVLLAMLCGVVAAMSLQQSFRSAEEAGRLEVEAREAREALGKATESAAATERERVRLQSDNLRLERELDAALTWTQALGEALAAEGERRERAAVERASASALALNPPPFGVQRCMLALRDCMRADGYEGMQLLRAASLEDQELRDVEFLTLDRESGRSELVVAQRLTARLDRATQTVALTFVTGHVRVDGLRTDIPPEGKVVRLVGVEGRMWEHKLPYFVQSEGSYVERVVAADGARAMDRETRETWLERLDALLVDAGSDLKLRVAGFVTLEGREFRSARLVGYDDKNLLALAADCERLAVEVDARARVVSLRLSGGTLRRAGSESSIHGEGFRMLLPNVTPERASMLLTGMVVER